MRDMPAYTLHDIWQFFLAFCAAIVTITAAIGAVMKWVNKAKQPSVTLINRVNNHDTILEEHNERIKDINTLLKKDKESIDRINEGNRVTQRALLAIMEQSISGGSTERLEQAKDELEKYLINK